MRRHLTFAALAIVIAALGAWFYANFERVTEREHVGFSGEAARNPLLALTRLMARMGLESRAIGSAAALDKLEAGAALVLPRGRAGYTTERASRLRSWVDAGGHLIVEAEGPGSRDTVLHALQVSATAGSGKGRAQPAEIRLPHAAKPLRVQMAPAVTLADFDRSGRTGYAASDDAGTLLLHRALGRGHVTVLPSFYFMTNLAIGEHDHAQLAWEIVRFVPGTRLVAIAPRFTRPSIFGWLAEEAREALIAAAALLLLWLWRAATRFGPIVAEPSPERRRLLDHLRASGRYFWAKGLRPRLVLAARDAALRHAARAHPDFAFASPEERVARLASLTSLPKQEVERFSAAAGAASGAEFVQLMHTAHRIHSALEKGHR